MDRRLVKLISFLENSNQEGESGRIVGHFEAERRWCLQQFPKRRPRHPATFGRALFGPWTRLRFFKMKRKPFPGPGRSGSMMDVDDLFNVLNFYNNQFLRRACVRWLCNDWKTYLSVLESMSQWCFVHFLNVCLSALSPCVWILFLLKNFFLKNTDSSWNGDVSGEMYIEKVLLLFYFAVVC